MRKFINFSTPLIAFAVTSSMGLAQDSSQQSPTIDHSIHHGQAGEPTGQQSRGSQMMGGMMDQGMMAQQMTGPQPSQPTMGCPKMADMMGQGGMMHQDMHMRVMMILMDTDGDGALSLEEVQAAHAKIFKAIDADKDGKATPTEVQMFFRGGSATSNQ
jgi:EF hand